MNTISYFFLACIIFFSFTACQPVEDEPIPKGEELIPPPPAGTSIIEGSPQRGGDAQAGYDYLRYGDFVDSGIPIALFETVFGADEENVLDRTGDNATIPPDYNAVNAPNGVRVVAPNCFTCHAQKLNGEYIVGLGNSFSDYTTDRSATFSGVDAAIELFYGADSPEWEAYQPFRDAGLATAPYLVTEAVGVNTADKLTAVLAAHRDKDDLTWHDEPTLPIPELTVPTDIPAWWLMKKKTAMFYNGSGRGDLARIMMASSLLTLKDSDKAEEVDTHFGDVYAFLQSIEPPVYPEAVDNVQMIRGRKVFNNHCSKCHGAYGEEEEYLNLLVDIEVIGTDPLLVNYGSDYADFVEWFNTGWFGQGDNAARFEFGNGYVAPPLDGVWATAPYLHNGSVPTLEDLLNSPQRPTYWKRTLNDSDYNFEKVGWNYSEEAASNGDKSIYDTTLPGYGNEGHYFGDVLTDVERSDLIEYLKTL